MQRTPVASVGIAALAAVATPMIFPFLAWGHPVGRWANALPAVASFGFNLLGFQPIPPPVVGSPSS